VVKSFVRDEEQKNQTGRTRAQRLDWRPYSQPVVLGTEKSHKYQLISCQGQWDIFSDIAEDTEESAIAVEIRSALASTKSPVQ